MKCLWNLNKLKEVKRMTGKQKPARYPPIELDPIKLRTQLALLKLKVSKLPWASKAKPHRRPR